MEETVPTTYFESRYSYRKKAIWIYIAFFTAVGLFALLKSSNLFRTVSIGGVVVLAVCWGLSGWLLFQFVSARELTVRIDASGIAWDKKHWPWSDIGWVWGRSEKEGIQLLFQRRGILSVDRHLLVDRGLSEEDYESLMERLTEDIQKRFPHVKFGC